MNLIHELSTINDVLLDLNFASTLMQWKSLKRSKLKLILTEKKGLVSGLLLELTFNLIFYSKIKNTKKADCLAMNTIC